MIVDAQIHVWLADHPDRPWPKAADGGRTASPQRPVPLEPPEVLSHMNRAGVDRAILVPPSWEGERNDLALAAAREHPDRFAVMGRIGPDETEAEKVRDWTAQAGMLGLRVILSKGSRWREEGAEHWLWRAAERAGVPIMIAPVGAMPVVADIAETCPDLRITIDHMAARLHQKGHAAFVDIELVQNLAKRSNVSVKATCLPDYSKLERPWSDVTPYVRRLFDVFGPERLFWGSDLSRLPCPYETLVHVFHEELDWLTGSDRDGVMGQSVLNWLGWR